MNKITQIFNTFGADEGTLIPDSKVTVKQLMWTNGLPYEGRIMEPYYRNVWCILQPSGFITMQTMHPTEGLESFAHISPGLFLLLIDTNHIKVG